MSSRRLAAVLVLASLVAVPATALGPGIVDLQVSGNTAAAVIAVGPLGLDFTVEFEEVSGLTPESLGLSARIPGLFELLGRLPAGVSLATGLPLLVTLQPTAAGGLT